MTDLPTFLLARIAEDEEIARKARGYPHLPTWALATVTDASPGGPRGTVEATPARVLADCDAKRRIVEAELLREVGPVSHYIDPDVHAKIRRRTVTPVLRLLALPYAEHSEFREEWKP